MSDNKIEIKLSRNYNHRWWADKEEEIHICDSGIRKAFYIPRSVNTIFLVISKVYVRGAQKGSTVSAPWPLLEGLSLIFNQDRIRLWQIPQYVWWWIEYEKNE